jgi:hypothetical protein
LIISGENVDAMGRASRTSLLEPTRIMPFPASQVENGPTLEIADQSEKAEALHESRKGSNFESRYSWAISSYS